MTPLERCTGPLCPTNNAWSLHAKVLRWEFVDGIWIVAHRERLDPPIECQCLQTKVKGNVCKVRRLFDVPFEKPVRISEVWIIDWRANVPMKNVGERQKVQGWMTMIGDLCTRALCLKFERCIVLSDEQCMWLLCQSVKLVLPRRFSDRRWKGVESSAWIWMLVIGESILNWGKLLIWYCVMQMGENINCAPFPPPSFFYISLCCPFHHVIFFHLE